MCFTLEKVYLFITKIILWRLYLFKSDLKRFLKSNKVALSLALNKNIWITQY